MMPDSLLVLDHVAVGYPRQPIFENLELTLASGQFVALVGPTGGGKTTLLKTILGLLPCQSGTVHRPPRLTMGYVPQREIIDWHFPVTVEQVVLMGRYRQTTPWPWPSRTDRRQGALLLERLGLASYAKRHIGQLSGGQQQRVFLARALIGEPQLLLLDEPTTGTDMKTQHDILHLLHELNAAGMTILLSTHDLNTVASHVPWVICFNRGVIAEGTPDEVLTPTILRQTYNAYMVVLKQGDTTFIANRSLVHEHTTEPGRLSHSSRRTAADEPAR
jgi:zinc/manganese transport system ATP-binding protein/zinc transport system ATP-binding protein